jgi:hypothetical protein
MTDDLQGQAAKKVECQAVHHDEAECIESKRIFASSLRQPLHPSHSAVDNVSAIHLAQFDYDVCESKISVCCVLNHCAAICAASARVQQEWPRRPA